jgi:hypothetical protein
MANGAWRMMEKTIYMIFTQKKDSTVPGIEPGASAV